MYASKVCLGCNSNAVVVALGGAQIDWDDGTVFVDNTSQRSIGDSFVILNESSCTADVSSSCSSGLWKEIYDNQSKGLSCALCMCE